MTYKPRFGSVRADKIICVICWGLVCFISFTYAKMLLDNPSILTAAVGTGVTGYFILMLALIHKREGMWWSWK